MHSQIENHETASSESFIHTSNTLLQSTLSLFSGLFALANLEAKLSIRHILIAFGLVIFSALLIMSGWLVFLAGLIVLLHGLGLSLAYSILSVIGINILLLILCLIAIKAYSQDIGLSRTLKQLQSLQRGQDEPA
ncbi:MAG: hypothetical protein Q7V63_07570 [Gammaproteobacteria bacterium]|nr:hypothetical protein [Gammaproteobacteria bacterium]